MGHHTLLWDGPFCIPYFSVLKIVLYTSKIKYYNLKFKPTMQLNGAMG